MKPQDLFFIASNVYLASALTDTKAAWCVGLFFGAVMIYYIIKGE